MAWDNRKRIQLARGTSAGLVNNSKMTQAGGQPIFISDKRYLTIGVNNNNGGENTVTKQVPIRARTLMGWYTDKEQVTGSEADTFEMTARPTKDDLYTNKYVLTADKDKTYFSSGKSLKFYRADVDKFDGVEVLTLDYSTNNSIVNVNSGDLRSSKLTVTNLYAGSAGTDALSNPVAEMQSDYFKTLKQLRLGNDSIHNAAGSNAYVLRSLSSDLQSDYIVTEANEQLLTNKTIDRVKLANSDANNIRTITTGENYTLGDACEKSYTDSESASAIGTGTALVTERYVYYGLPFINGAHDYTSSTSIYAPTSQLATATGKKFLVGAASSTSINSVSSNESCYMDGGHLYSDGKKALNVGTGGYAQTLKGSLEIDGYLYV